MLPAAVLLCLRLCGLLVGLVEAPSPVEPPERSRPYAVLRGQNLGESRGLQGAGSGLRFSRSGPRAPGGGRGGCGVMRKAGERPATSRSLGEKA